MHANDEWWCSSIHIGHHLHSSFLQNDHGETTLRLEPILANSYQPPQNHIFSPHIYTHLHWTIEQSCLIWGMGWDSSAVLFTGSEKPVCTTMLLARFASFNALAWRKALGASWFISCCNITYKITHMRARTQVCINIYIYMYVCINIVLYNYNIILYIYSRSFLCSSYFDIN